MGIYISTKTFTENDGLSCSYRLWQSANQHQKLHGAALCFKLVFECHHLTDDKQTIDLLDLEHVRDWLRSNFSFTVCVAHDDPELESFVALSQKGLIDIRIMPAVGCEKFAEATFRYVMDWLHGSGLIRRVTIRSVECIEHGGNGSLYVE